MIDLTINKGQLERAIQRARQKKIVIPTFRQMKNPHLIPEAIKKKLKAINLWEIHPSNLFRITWKNEPIDFGGGFGEVNTMEIPSEISGVDARIIALRVHAHSQVEFASPSAEDHRSG